MSSRLSQDDGYWARLGYNKPEKDAPTTSFSSKKPKTPRCEIIDAILCLVFGLAAGAAVMWEIIR